MKKTILTILLCEILLLGITGCGFKNNNKELEALKEEMNSLKQKLEEKNDDDSLEEHVEINNLYDLKQMVNNNNKKIEDLEDKIKDLQDINSSLSKKVTALETSNKSLKSTVDSLKSSSSSNTSNQYTITKKQLIGTWTFNGHDFLVFNESNCDIIGNWIIYHNKNYDSSVYYMYKNGKLYITDDGVVYSKK